MPEENVREVIADPPLVEGIVHELRVRDSDVADGVEFAYEAACRKLERFKVRVSDVEWREVGTLRT